MKRSIAPRHFISVVLFVVVGLPWLIAGCAPRTKAVFALSELRTYERLAVLGLTPEREQVFMACYIKGFPGQTTTFVERTRLKDIIKEQDLSQGRLDDNTRAKLKVFGIEALVMCNYDEGLGGQGPNKLRVRIVDITTGAIVGSVITEAGSNFEFHCRQAVRALRQELYGSSR